MVVKLDGNTLSMPNAFVGNLMNEAMEQTSLAALSAPKPQSLSKTETRVYNGGIEADFVNEGERKMVSEPTYKSVVLTPRKLATIVTVSEEIARLDPHGQVAALENQMRDALRGALERAIITGRRANGDLLGGDVTYLTQTSNVVEGGLTQANIQGAYNIVDSSSYNTDPDGILVANKARTQALQMATYGNAASGNFPNPLVNLRNRSFMIGGLNGVSTKHLGRVVPTGESDVAVVGDFGKLVWGYGLDILIKKSTEASVVTPDGTTLNLWQDNLIGYLVEAQVAWYVDSSKYCRITG